MAKSATSIKGFLDLLSAEHDVVTIKGYMDEKKSSDEILVTAPFQDCTNWTEISISSDISIVEIRYEGRAVCNNPLDKEKAPHEHPICSVDFSISNPSIKELLSSIVNIANNSVSTINAYQEEIFPDHVNNASHCCTHGGITACCGDPNYVCCGDYSTGRATCCRRA